MQYNQVLQGVLLAQFEMQAAPGQFRAEVNLPDDIVDRALQGWQAQQQVCWGQRVGGACARAGQVPAGAWAARCPWAASNPAKCQSCLRAWASKHTGAPVAPLLPAWPRPAPPAPAHPGTPRPAVQAAKLSAFQLEVSEALGVLGVEHELEYLTAVNLLSVDIAIVKGGE